MHSTSYRSYRLLLVAMASILCLGGCMGKGGVLVHPELTTRHLSLMVRLDAGSLVKAVTGPAPLTVQINPIVSGGVTDDDDEHKPLAVELDPADGSGWLDITAEYCTWIQQGTARAASASGIYSYTYTEPGEYQISARVTWWDSEVTTATGATVTVTEPEGGQPSGEEGFDEEDDWVIREFTDPRDDTTYDIIDGRALVAFFLPVDMDAAWQFVADENLEILSEWWFIGSIAVLLPVETSVEEAVGEWPDRYPGLIEAVDPDVPSEI